MSTILIVLLILLLFIGLPQFTGTWHNAGYAPSGLITVVVVILVVLLLTGRL